jgi:hypothetical protein
MKSCEPKNRDKTRAERTGKFEREKNMDKTRAERRGKLEREIRDKTRTERRGKWKMIKK